MKKITSFFIFICCLASYCQGYEFSVSTETYQNLTSGTSINDGEVWDDPEYAVPIGFDFEIGNHSFSTIYFSIAGTGGILSPSQNLESSIPFIVPVAQDLVDLGEFSGVSQSPLTYQLSGEPGNQILKIEWENAGFWDDATQEDFISFQVWLYEDSNIIEYHYGPNSIENSLSFEDFDGIFTALLPSANLTTGQADASVIFLQGDPTDPTVVETMDPDQETTGLNGAIPSGTVYTFTPEGMNVSGFSKSQFVIHPNPAINFINIESLKNIVEVNIYNNLGQRLSNFDLHENVIDISSLLSGIYFLEVKTEDGRRAVQKFLKK